MQTIGFESTYVRRALVGSLLFGALLVGVHPALAQQVPTTDADRITRMRDQAGQAKAPVDTTSQAPVAALIESDVATKPAGQVGAGEAVAEEPKPLPANERLLLGQSEGDLFLAGDGSEAGKGNLGDGWLLSTLAALGVVIALVFGLRWMLRRGGIVASAAPQGSIVEVLSRTTVAPRSHVVLLRIGQRILIVNDSPSGMRTLASVHEPEEVADLLGAIDAARPSSMTKSFGGVMSRLSQGWSSSEVDQDDVEPGDSTDDGVVIDQTRGAVTRVRGRLAALAGGGLKA